MPTDGSSEHEVVLRGAHEARLNGLQMKRHCGVGAINVPDLCGCVTTFKPAGYIETGDDGIVREVWVQDGFKFNKHLPPL